MIPPHSLSIKQLAEADLFNWRKEVRSKGILMPYVDACPQGWHASDKFAAVIESAFLNKQET